MNGRVKIYDIYWKDGTHEIVTESGVTLKERQPYIPFFNVVIDENIPKDEIHFRQDGKCVGKIMNIGKNER